MYRVHDVIHYYRARAKKEHKNLTAVVMESF